MGNKDIKTHVIASALVKCNGKYLALQRSEEQKFAPGEWELPWTYVNELKPVEEILIEAIQNKTGLTGKVTKTSIPYILDDLKSRWIVIPFIVEVKKNNYELKEEHATAAWLTKDRIKLIEDIAEDVLFLEQRGMFK